jgi:hypothetical protein
LSFPQRFWAGIKYVHSLIRREPTASGLTLPSDQLTLDELSPAKGRDGGGAMKSWRVIVQLVLMAGTVGKEQFEQMRKDLE